jgi:hypothetical protein
MPRLLFEPSKSGCPHLLCPIHESRWYANCRCLANVREADIDLSSVAMGAAPCNESGRERISHQVFSVKRRHRSAGKQRSEGEIHFQCGHEIQGRAEASGGKGFAGVRLLTWSSRSRSDIISVTLKKLSSRMIMWSQLLMALRPQQGSQAMISFRPGISLQLNGRAILLQGQAHRQS